MTSLGPDPRTVPLEHTLEFLGRVLDTRVHRVLEVGCGRGALAQALIARGLEVTAIDSSQDAVATARERGVPAMEVDLLSFEAAPFDAVLFTRSLHHVGPLAPAIERARDLLEPGGLAVLEEFAYERMDAATATWYEQRQSALAGRLLDADPDPDAPADPLERWHWFHRIKHGVHPGAAMRAALDVDFETVFEESSPYLYRWFADRLPADVDGLRETAATLGFERRGLSGGTLQAIGMRLVARRR